MKVKLSLHDTAFNKKPANREIAVVSKEIADYSFYGEVQEIAFKIGKEGHTFCPAIFNNGKRKAEEFKEMQLFALDFDKQTTFNEVKAIANRYNLPIAFAYETFSSTKELPKFRVVFQNDIPITNRCAAEIMLKMLLRIFEKADKSCNDVSRMFFGGKGVIGEVDGENTINIVTLSESFQRFLYETTPQNYTRELTKFADSYNIRLINMCLQIFNVHNDGSFEDFLVSDLCIYISDSKFSSNYVIHKGYQAHERKVYFTDSLVRADFNTIENKCKLFSDFKNKQSLSHAERFLLLSNLIHINGGKKKFLKICSENYDKKKWGFYAKYIKDKGYKPQSCNGNCPYASACNHKSNLVLTLKNRDKIEKISSSSTYYSIDQVYQFMNESLTSAMLSNKGIHIIPAQTAVGKTEAYCNLVMQYDKQNFIIAVPTNKLKREVESRLRAMGVEALTSLSIDEMHLPKSVREKVQFYYSLGLGNKVACILKQFIKNNEDSTDCIDLYAVNQCQEYLSLKKKIGRCRVAITTHARLAVLPSELLSAYTVIIDEDILSTFFKNIRTVSIQAIANALGEESCPSILKNRLKQIIETPKFMYARIRDPISFEQLSEETLETLRIMENVNEIANASVYHRGENEVQYFCPQSLPSGKYIILSATIASNIYRLYFKRWCIIEYPYYKAKYKGCVKQYSAYTMSRLFMKTNDKVLKTFLEQLQSDYSIITFKEFEDVYVSSDLHFGNVEGIDSLKGKNIAVVGTPHMNEFVYKLIGCHLGMEVNDDVISVRRIEYGDYKFNIMTYKQDQLRNLQLYFISKELEQCIGRARLLRNDCTVIVLSNFPCEQAELFQDDYLKIVEGDEVSPACNPELAGYL